MSAIIVGPVIAFVSLVSYFMVFARFPVLRDVPWLNAPLALLGCYLSIRALMVALKNRQQWLRLSFSGLGLLFSVGISSLFFFYITVLSYQMPKGGKTESDLGQIPNIESTTHTGAPFTSADLGGKNWVIVFYRGHW